MSSCPAETVGGTNDVVMISPQPPRPHASYVGHPIEIDKDRVRLAKPIPRGYEVWYSDGLAVVRIGQKWGYIDQEFKIVIEPKFEDARSFSEGFGLVVMGYHRYRYLRKDGRYLVESEFEGAYPFKHGLGSVKKAGKFGLIDPEGHWVLEPKYDGALDPAPWGFEGYYLGGRTEYLDKRGKLMKDFDPSIHPEKDRGSKP